MRINNIQPYRNYSTPTFTDTHRMISNIDGEMKYQTTSYLFREDLDWNSLSALLHEKYKDTPKVNVIMHACSDGSEPYSLIMKLLADYKDDASKFFKIDARDIDYQNIQYAKFPSFRVALPSLPQLEKFTNARIRDFFETDFKLLSDGLYLTKKNLLTDNVKFTQSDLVEDIYKFKGENTVLFARNVWPYIKDWSLKDYLIKTLSEKMDKTSLFVIGEFDKENKLFVNLLKNYGLAETSVPNVYQKGNVIPKYYFNPIKISLCK